MGRRAPTEPRAEMKALAVWHAGQKETETSLNNADTTQCRGSRQSNAECGELKIMRGVASFWNCEPKTRRRHARFRSIL